MDNTFVMSVDGRWSPIGVMIYEKVTVIEICSVNFLLCYPNPLSLAEFNWLHRMGIVVAIVKYNHEIILYMYGPALQSKA